MHKNLILKGIFLLLIGCETTAPITKIKEILPEPTEKVIYQPDENTSIANKEVLDETEIEIEVQDFLAIENYIQKEISSVISTYGNFNFSKKDEIYELHRYNANKCRIFIQNNTSNKKIISITIFHIEEKKVLKNYKKDLCH
ncbi:MAG: hypothetical protein EVA57_01845 [alpha proteobacterium HIMB59]|jgi:hypothetical protein|nr:MAG: hypothetical protein EVA57_01845 [alpha proteobacterium HIMB59]|tara:strand:+ start:235 stop:660 length:426 start_codon:yes stop_codon:yes gene_type:complete